MLRRSRAQGLDSDEDSSHFGGGLFTRLFNSRKESPPLQISHPNRPLNVSNAVLYLRTDECHAGAEEPLSYARRTVVELPELLRACVSYGNDSACRRLPRSCTWQPGETGAATVGRLIKIPRIQRHHADTSKFARPSAVQTPSTLNHSTNDVRIANQA